MEPRLSSTDTQSVFVVYVTRSISMKRWWMPVVSFFCQHVNNEQIKFVNTLEKYYLSKLSLYHTSTL